MLSSLNKQQPVAIITSDTSGTWGCGAVCNMRAHRWIGHSILVRSDNIITISAIHIADDAISRDNLPLFFSLCPQAHRRPTPIQSRSETLLILLHESATPSFPASEGTFCRFAAWLANKGIAHGTTRVYISSVRQLQISMGLPVDGMARLSQVLKGIH